jgi:hypothetical protein
MAFIAGPRVQSATGGSISTISGYTVHTFTTIGNSTFRPTTTGQVEVLVVGGGGGGYHPATYSGGGGAGSVLYSKFVPVIAGVGCTVTIGAGGAAAANGSQSVFYYVGPTAPGTNITASGGGFGNLAAGNGGSRPTGSGGGGGGSSNSGPGGVGGTGAGVLGFGFPGGNSGGVGPIGGGGGGGAGGAGTNGVNGVRGIGGPGLTYTISGSSVTYGRGGDGLWPTTTTAPGGNYGDGGSGNSSAPTAANAIGTQGIVIIRYPT